MGAERLGELVLNLPAGCALWLSIGGPLSLTVEAEQLRWVEYDLRVLAWQNTKDGTKGNNPPTPPQKVPYASDRAAKATAAAEKGARWQRIQQARNARAQQQQLRDLRED